MYLINSFICSGWWNRRNHRQTIYPTESLNSMNLLQMSCVITWAWSFLTTQVVEAVKHQKHLISAHSLALYHSVHPTAPVLLTKIHQEIRSVMTFSLLSASISQILVSSYLSEITFISGIIDKSSILKWNWLFFHVRVNATLQMAKSGNKSSPFASPPWQQNT